MSDDEIIKDSERRVLLDANYLQTGGKKVIIGRKERSTPSERFHLKYEVDAETGCWNWTACLNGKAGYGQFWDGARVVLAHRFAYELLVGPIGDGLNALHRCDNPRCCNPAHVFLGTQKDNAADMIAKGRDKDGRKAAGPKISAAKTGVKRGPLTDEWRAKVSASLMGRIVIPETRAKISVAHTGREHSAETRARISEAKRGCKMSDEARAKMSAALKGKPKTAEHRAKIAAARIGTKRSDETRAKISAANRRRWARERMEMAV